ncbi:NEDD8-activating enzyme E1 regulatory subunit [Hondaea fermentalgiana]|uniref:NEDD8-activating enzyme E1 regulatory subunit n=1 Tax=Hondaea fermentalgiana TaxID=2315210 RepID=A0A2R5GF49_9STRA|nr:NEDD8-activating enzyme E1 regulatory subunit [Hondaea fermentalgiana]|eukprot:GBG27243.1 NEDD8-activating enzyme E1 regulatory subunit [Hondaea fermentalgiana]
MDEAGAKYDRQLRLWGSHGQKSLAEAHILLLKAGPTGTETLKNLVLPGIGKFTVVDDENVGEADVSNNFFVTQEYLGKGRAETTCELLQELNPDVKGEFVVSDPVEFVTRDSTVLNTFTLVIATEMPEQNLLAIEEALLPHNVPMVVARTYGFIGVCRIVSHTHCVIESKPSPEPMEDLRIADPFPELEAFVDGIDLAAMDSKDFMHTPFVVVLVQLMKKWRAEHDNKLPTTMAEKKEFKELVKQQARKSWGEEENLLEAFDKAFLAYTPKEIPPEVSEEVFSHPYCGTEALPSGLGPFNMRFWVLARALKAFVEDQGSHPKLPLSGKLPDMTATTGMYVDMQRIYKAKADADANAVYDRCLGILQAQGLDMAIISREDVKEFCKNAYYIRVTQNSRISDEIDPAKVNKEDLEMAVMEGVGDSGPQSPLLMYIMLRACDRFHSKHGRFPGQNGRLELADSDETDIQLLLALAQEIGTELSLDSPLNLSSDHAKEFVRYAAVEMHNMAAILGGIASQEAVKLITHQYVVLSNIYVFNGITCTGASFAL